MNNQSCEPWRHPRPNRDLWLQAIRREVSSAFGFTEKELFSRARPARLAWARQVAMWLMLELAGESPYSLGQRFHRDHVTIGHAKKKVEDLISVYADLARELSDIRARVCERVKNATNQ